ncbi:MAG: cyclic nucleotide-binding domain-containing protein [Desulfovibrionaceae bacterium]|nr:cyclic nucleotide-binding domain-containing protein [Desulfovibrionaceae bacterium]
MIEQLVDPSRPENIERLRGLQVFAVLDPVQLAEAVRLTRIRKYGPGETIIREGEYDHWIYFLIKGRVRVSYGGVEICRLKNHGDVFGEMGIIDGSPRSASIEALDQTLCLAVDASFMDRLEESERVSAQAKVYRVLAEYALGKLRDVNERIAKAHNTKDGPLKRVMFKHLD